MFPNRPSLLRLPSSMVNLLDEAAIAFGMCRSDVIRRSPSRDLDFVQSYEIPNAEKQAGKGTGPTDGG